jgi:hypothetical protein
LLQTSQTASFSDKTTPSLSAESDKP